MPRPRSKPAAGSPECLEAQTAARLARHVYRTGLAESFAGELRVCRQVGDGLGVCLRSPPLPLELWVLPWGLTRRWLVSRVATHLCIFPTFFRTHLVPCRTELEGHVPASTLTAVRALNTPSTRARSTE